MSEPEDALRRYLAEADARFDADVGLLGTHYQGTGYHSRMPDGVWVHPTRENLNYALALLRSGEPSRVERAATIVRRVLQMQDRRPTSATYGIWPYLAEEPLSEMAPPDWNWADFNGALLAHMLHCCTVPLPEGLEGEMRSALGHAAWAIFRRNVGPSYTNIAVMGAAVTLMAGELLDEERLVDYGRVRLHDLVEHTRQHGSFNEYNSPTYTIVALHECERVLQFVRNATARAYAEELRVAAWRVVAEHYHPGTHQWAGPHSRAYSDRLRPDVAAYLSEATGVPIPVHPAAEELGRGAYTQVTPLPCPSDVVPRFRALPEEPLVVRRQFIRRQTEELSTWGTTWFVEDACLGSVNHDDMWTQRRPLIGYWRTAEDPAVVLRARFLRDGTDFASGYLRNAQEGGRVLSALGMLTDRGDWHVHLDRPRDGVFHAGRFALRYELDGTGAEAVPLGEGTFELRAGARRAVVHTAEGSWGAWPVRWAVGEEEGCAYVEGVCYEGPERAFDFRELGQVVVVAGVEILADGEAPAEEPVRVEILGGDLLQATWGAGGAMALRAPNRPHPYA